MVVSMAAVDMVAFHNGNLFYFILFFFLLATLYSFTLQL